MERQHQCKFVMTETDKRCGMESLIGEDYCISHSTSEIAKEHRRKKGKLTIEDLLRTFEQQFNSVKANKEIAAAEKAKLLLSISNKIDEYRDVLESKEKKTQEPETTGGDFQDKIKRAKEKLRDD